MKILFAIMMGLLLTGCDITPKAIPLGANDYAKFCIEGVTYVVVNNGASNMAMSVMLNTHGNVIVCDGHPN
jgi:hypothetical protein